MLVIGVIGAVAGGIFTLLMIIICAYLWHKKYRGDSLKKLIVKFPLPFTRNEKKEKRLRRKKAVKKKSTAVLPEYTELAPGRGEETGSDSASSIFSGPLPSPSTEPKPCLLHFSLYYNDSHLYVNIISVDNVPHKLFGRLPSSYVKLQLSSERALPCQTEVHTNNLNPVFRESFEFIGYSYNEVTSMNVFMSLFVYDRFSQGHLMGQTSLALSEVEWKPTFPVQFCRELIPKRSRRSSSCSSCPDIKGELFLSLRYQAKANRIAVTVLKALELSRSSKILSTDPYVSITLKCDGQVIEKKHTKKKKRTVNPVWNQSFLFDVKKDLIDKYELLFDVLDYDLIFPSSHIGNIAVGPNASGSGKIHWDNMIAKKGTRSEVAMSHML